MEDFSISEYYDEGKIGKGANALRFLLLPFMCFVLFGFPGDDIGGIVSTLSRFTAPAFFILYGFFVLVGDRDVRLEKLRRAVKRTGLTFLVLFVVYFAINAIYLTATGVDWIPEIFRKRMLFEFLVMNLWPMPMGDCIWFIQSLFYAYVILFALEKLRLLRFYKPLLIILLLFMLISGEFAGIIRLDIMGYTYIPGNFITRALPYLLIGMFIRENQETLLKPKKGVYILSILIGLGLAYLEIELLYATGSLIYSGHLLGLGLAAIAMCCWALSVPMIGSSFATAHGRSYTRRIYALCQPVAFLLTIAAEQIGRYVPDIVEMFLSVITYMVCLLLAFLISLIKFKRYAPSISDEDDDDESDYQDFRRKKAEQTDAVT